RRGVSLRTRGFPRRAHAMTTAVAPPAVPATARPARVGLRAWQAPLVPIALAGSAGIILDRHFDVPLPISLMGALASLAAFVLHGFDRRPLPGLLYLWTGCAALGCGYHHWHRNSAAVDDVRYLASDELRPVRLRGVVESPPTVTKSSGDPAFRSFQKKS